MKSRHAYADLVKCCLLVHYKNALLPNFFCGIWLGASDVYLNTVVS